MQQKLTLKMRPSEAADATFVKNTLAAAAAVDAQQVTGYHILKKSIDARGKQAWVQLTVLAFINEPFNDYEIAPLELQEVSHAAKRVVIVGAGPAGLFCALRLIEAGIKPVILERGKDVRARRRDLATMNKEGVVNEESNYCFGEGKESPE